MERELEFERVFFLFFRRRCRPLSFILTSFSCALSPPPPPSPPPQWATSPTACPRRCSPTSSPRWGPSRRHGEFGGLSVVCDRGALFLPLRRRSQRSPLDRREAAGACSVTHAHASRALKKKRKSAAAPSLHSARDKNASLPPPRPPPAPPRQRPRPHTHTRTKKTPLHSLAIERDTGKQRGYGFCEFYDIETAAAAARALDGREIAGRALRVGFAEDSADPSGGTGYRVSAGVRVGGGGGGRGGDPHGSPRGPLLLAAPAAAAAAASLLGAPPPPPGSAADEISAVLGRKTRFDLEEILAQMQQLTRRDPAAARALLVANPQLAAALFQAQVMLGVVAADAAQNPLGPAAAPVPLGALPPPPPPPPPSLPGLQQQQQQQHRDHHLGGFGQIGGAAALAPPPPPPPPPRQLDAYPGVEPPTYDAPPGPAAPFGAIGTGAPRGGRGQAQPPQPPQPQPPQPQEAEMLQQVLALTPAQVAALPGDQREQVEALQAYMRSQQQQQQL